MVLCTFESKFLWYIYYSDLMISRFLRTQSIMTIIFMKSSKRNKIRDYRKLWCHHLIITSSLGVCFPPNNITLSLSGPQLPVIIIVRKSDFLAQDCHRVTTFVLGWFKWVISKFETYIARDGWGAVMSLSSN